MTDYVTVRYTEKFTEDLKTHLEEYLLVDADGKSNKRFKDVSEEEREEILDDFCWGSSLLDYLKEGKIIPMKFIRESYVIPEKREEYPGFKILPEHFVLELNLQSPYPNQAINLQLNTQQFKILE